MELGVHAGECGSAAPPAERGCPLAKEGNNTHAHTGTQTHTRTVLARSAGAPKKYSPLELPGIGSSQRSCLALQTRELTAISSNGY
jgi:hypothetical protein